jgi:hypothetical protein
MERMIQTKTKRDNIKEKDIYTMGIGLLKRVRFVLSPKGC